MEPGNPDTKTRNDFADAVDFMKQARYDEAIDLLEQVIARAPGLTAPHIDLAVAYEQTKNAEKAEEHLKAALALIPGHPVASNIYGLLLRKNGRFAEARKIYEASLDRFPEYLPTRKNLGILCELYLDDPAGALEQFEIYSEAAPEDPQVTIWIASLRQRLGSTE
jgi:Tfp pilus assembly protein PilF